MANIIFGWKTPLSWFVDLYDLNSGYTPAAVFVVDGDAKTIEMKCEAKAVAQVHDETFL